MRTNNIQEALGAGNDDVLSIRAGPSMRKETVNLKWSNEEYSGAFGGRKWKEEKMDYITISRHSMVVTAAQLREHSESVGPLSPVATCVVC